LPHKIFLFSPKSRFLSIFYELRQLDFLEYSNKEILYSLEYLSEDFEQTKNTIVKLTYHLDSTEQLYNKILKEYEKRTNGKSIIK
jgi:hypothetical protein